MRYLLLFIFSLLISNIFAGDRAPEFGDSVDFAEDGPTVKLSDLKGKVVIIVFFQEWCPLCNKWSGEKFKDAEKAFANDLSIVLIAMKTDGGGVSAAKNYLRDRVNRNNWIIATDKNAKYYKEINGKEELYKYAVIDGLGKISTISGFGSNQLAKMNFKDGYNKSPALLDGIKVPDRFKTEARAVELGDYKAAIVKLKGLEKDREIGDETKEFQKNIFSSLEKRIDELGKKVADETNLTRFEDFMTLRSLGESLAGFKLQNNVVVLHNQFKSEAFFKKELAAETSYNTYLKNLQVIKKSDIEKYKESFIPKFIETHNGTYYAGVIQKELKDNK